MDARSLCGAPLQIYIAHTKLRQKDLSLIRRSTAAIVDMILHMVHCRSEALFGVVARLKFYKKHINFHRFLKPKRQTLIQCALSNFFEFFHGPHNR